MREGCDGHIDNFVAGVGIFFTANEMVVAHEVLGLICKSTSSLANLSVVTAPWLQMLNLIHRGKCMTKAWLTQSYANQNQHFQTSPEGRSTRTFTVYSECVSVYPGVCVCVSLSQRVNQRLPTLLWGHEKNISILIPS